jgi:2'-5' RNA ligase
MLRLFVAIRPPSDVIDRLIDTMEGIENARWQDEEQLHLTLAFAGDVEHRTAEDLVAALAAVRCDPFDLVVAGVDHFERKGRVTAIWARVAESEALGALQRRVSRACESVGIELEHRRFIPHITMARFSQRAPEVPDWLARHARLHCAPFTVDHFALFRSHLSTSGVNYDELAQFGRQFES